jgi:hypothetical protein
MTCSLRSCQADSTKQEYAIIRGFFIEVTLCDEHVERFRNAIKSMGEDLV